MPRIRYSVAMSLDGYIAGPKGEADWIIMDADIDFAGLFAQFDTFLLGRRTFEAMAAAKGPGLSGAQTFVFSRSLQPRDHPGVGIVAEVPPRQLLLFELELARTSGYSGEEACFAVFWRQDSWIR